MSTDRKIAAGLLKARSPAKLNLTFDIAGTLPGGYHAVETLMQSIDIEDELTFEARRAEEPEITIKLDELSMIGGVPLNGTNLVARAFHLMAARGHLSEVAISASLLKRIPAGSGMAGGSGNAAATLLAMRSLARDSLTDSDLAEMAGQLGADAPFCLSGGTAVGRGRGDDLTPVDRMLDLVFVVTIPRGLTLSTASVYEWYDDDLKTCADKRPTGLGLEDAVRGLETGDLELTVRSLGNVLEPVVFARHPALRDVKEKILSLGAWCCHMTGSGSALYAVVPDVEMAHFIRRKILQLDVDVLMARSISSGARLVDVPNNAWLKGI